MKNLIRRKLRNITPRMISRLLNRANELSLPNKDLFVLTSLSMIKSLSESYDLGLKFNEDLSLKSFVTECQKIIDSLIIGKQEPFFV